MKQICDSLKFWLWHSLNMSRPESTNEVFLVLINNLPLQEGRSHKLFLFPFCLLAIVF